jgi:hypothetical protein
VPTKHNNNTPLPMLSDMPDSLKIAIKCFIEKLTPKEIWLWLCDSKEYETIEWDSVYKLIVRIGNKLNMKR